MPDNTIAVPGPVLDKDMRTPDVNVAPKMGFRIPPLQSSPRRVRKQRRHHLITGPRDYRAGDAVRAQPIGRDAALMFGQNAA
jgi:hypothetical protein